MINWVDGSGNFIGNAPGVNVANDGSPHTVSTQGQAPVGAAGFRLYWDANGSTSGFAGQLYIGGITVRQANGGTMVIDGSLTASKIAAGTITGDRIAGGTITGDKISSSSSLPASLSIGNTGFTLGTVQSAAANGSNGSNLLTYSDYQAGTGGWYVSYNPSNSFSGGWNAGGVNGQIDQGRNYMYWQFYTPNTYANDANQQMSISSNQFQVIPGTYVYSGAYFQGDQCDITMVLWFYAGDGTTLISGLGAPYWTLGVDPTWPGSGSSWEGCRKGVFGYVPTNAAFGRVEIYSHSRASDSKLHTAYVANPMVIVCTPGQTTPPAYVPGPAPNTAAVINANTTLIGAGKISISGGTTVQSLLYGGDNTKIDGGAIAANTVTANKLTIGHRNLNFPAVSFQVINGGNSMVCSTGYAQYLDANGNMQQVTLQGGTVTPGQGFWYIYWTEGAGGYGFTTDASVATRSDTVCLCTWYSPSYLMVQNYGGTIIDGSMITTGSINASQTITAGSIVTGNLQDNSVTSWILASNPGPFAGGTQSGSGSGGGGGGVVYCVADTSHMPFGLRAGALVAGDDLAVLNRDDDLGWHVEPVHAIDRATVPCARLTTSSGITLVVSLSTPITLRDGVVVDLRDAIGLDVPVMDKRGFRWERLVGIEHVGDLPVTLIDVNNGTFAAGEQPGAYIFTHNKTVSQP